MAKKTDWNKAILKYAPFCAVLWLLYVMNTVFAWIPFSVILRIVGVFGVLAASYLMKSHQTSKSRRAMAFYVFLYFLWALIKMGHFLAFVSVAMTFVPVLCLLFWPNDKLNEVYTLFRKVVIFFAIGSSIITILSFVGLTSFIPHFELPGQSALHTNKDDFYQIFIIFPQLNTISSVTMRACGMMEEPGHFAIVLGFVYMIDRYLHRKINPAIIICGILTFSSAFFLIFFFTEFWNIFKYWKKTILYMASAFLVGVIIYSSLPSDAQDAVRFLAYERNLEKVTEAFSSSGSLDEALDERTNQYATRVYDRMSFGKKLIGDEWDEDMILSDYRGFIVRMGYIGLFFVIMISLMSISGAPFHLKVSLLLTLFLIIIHRSWFYYEPFPYFMSFLACTIYKYNRLSQCLNR